MLAQLLLKCFLPWHETEAQAVVNHSELTAGKLGCAHKLPHDIIAGNCRFPRPPTFGGKRPASAFKVALIELLDKVFGRTDAAILEAVGQSHVHQRPFAALQGVGNFAPESGVFKRCAVWRYKLAVKPGRTLRFRCRMGRSRQQKGGHEGPP
jgi:hypothetical protein